MNTKTWTPETLSEKVCKKGHKGEYSIRNDNSIACRVCSREAIEKHRKNNPPSLKIRSSRGTKTLPSVGQITKLKDYIAELENQLEVAKKRLELSEEMVRLYNELKATKKIG